MQKQVRLARRRGKLIVLEGTDGSGKATQTRLLVRRLKKAAVPVQTLSFPRYQNHVSGKLLAECLQGLHGDFATLDPYIGSILYALDRLEAKEKLVGWLAQGYTVVLDRYVTSNQIHQGGKLPNAREKLNFLQWLDYLEHELFGLPRPDLVIHLDVPPQVSKRLIENDGSRKRTRTGRGKGDVVERDAVYATNSRRSALELMTQQKNWKTITCYQEGVLRSIDDIHEDVATLTSKLLKRVI